MAFKPVSMDQIKAIIKKDAVKKAKYRQTAHLKFKIEVDTDQDWHTLASEITKAIYQCSKINKYPTLSYRGGGVLSIEATQYQYVEGPDREGKWYLSPYATDE
tara:strand:- start:353 stop:661 length:309 start_codon:yes stop_codon:yes gene_type:complete